MTPKSFHLAGIAVVLVGCSREAPTLAPLTTDEARTVDAGSVSPSPASSATKRDPDELVFEAIVKISREEGPGKRFRGVILEPIDANAPMPEPRGRGWIANYRSDALWDAFEGRRVTVKGHAIVPEGQALVGPHIHVVSWKIEKPSPADRYVAVGVEETRSGKVVREIVPAGRKAAGEPRTTFVARSGDSYELVNSDVLAKTSWNVDEVKLRVREVTLSPFATHVGGRHLWVLGVVDK